MRLDGAGGGGVRRPSRYPPEETGAMGAVMMKDETTCIRCAMCASRCPTHAILMKHFDFYRECVTRRRAQSQGGAMHRSSHARSRICTAVVRLQPCRSGERPALASQMCGPIRPGLSALHCCRCADPSASVQLPRARACRRIQRGAHPDLHAPGSAGRSRRAEASGLLGRLAGLASGARMCSRAPP